MPADYSTDPYAAGFSEATAAKAPQDAKTGIEAIASETRVPANILMAFVERTSAPDDATRITVAKRVAEQISPRIQAGENVDDIILGAVKDQTEGRKFLTRAYQIGHELYPERVPEERYSKTERLGRAFDVGEAQAVQMGHEYTRDAAAALEESAFGRVIAKVNKAVGTDARSAEERAQAIRTAPDPVADAARRTIEGIQADGYNIADWKDIRGLGSLVQFMGENIATSLPQMGASIASGPLSAPLTIAMLGGEANQELKERTDLSEGERVSLATGAGTAMWALESIGLGKVVGGLLPSDFAKKAVRGELADLLTKNGLKKSAARVMEAAVVEGSTEAMQEAIVMGAAAAAGGEYKRDEVIDRIATAFAAGAGAGGGIRAAGEPLALLRGNPPEAGQIEDPGEPPLGLPSPAMVTPPPPRRTVTPDDATGLAVTRLNDLDARAADLHPDEAEERDFLRQNLADPERLASRMGVQLGRTTEPVAPAAPSGPLSRALSKGPGPIVPDAQPGTDITLMFGSDRIAGRITDDDGVKLTVEDAETGEVFEIPRADFEGGQVSIAPRITDDVVEAAAVDPESPLSARAKSRAPAKDPLADGTEPTTPEEALRRASVIEDHAREAGWTARLRDAHDALTGIAEQLAKDREKGSDKDPAPTPETLAPDVGQIAASPAPAVPGLAVADDAGADAADVPLDASTEQQGSEPALPADTLDGGPAAAPAPIVKKDGSPFGNEGAAKRAVKSRGLDPEAFDFMPVDGGVVAVPRAAVDEAPSLVDEMAAPAPEATDAVDEVALVAPSNDARPSPEPDMPPPVGEAAEIAPGADAPAPAPAAIADAPPAPDPEPAPGLETDEAADADAWAQVGASKRESIVREAGYLKAGNISDEGRSMVEADWQDVSPAARQRLRDAAQTLQDRLRPADVAAPVRPRPQAQPMPAPDARVQPDMFGGPSQTETQMAAKEQTAREWGKFLGIADRGTTKAWDGVVEGHDIYLRDGTNIEIVAPYDPNEGPQKVLASRDVDGMSRAEIARWARSVIPPRVIEPADAPAAEQAGENSPLPHATAPQERPAATAYMPGQTEPAQQVKGAFEWKGRDGGVANVSVTPEGPWDFDTTFPSPDVEKITGRLRDGRNDFEAGSPEEVVGMLGETIADIADQRAGQAFWQDVKAQIEETGKAPKGAGFKNGMSRDDMLAKAETSRQAAEQAGDGIEAELRNIFPDEAVDALSERMKKQFVLEAPEAATAEAATADIEPERIERLPSLKRGAPPLMEMKVVKTARGYEVEGGYEVPGFAGGSLSSSAQPTPEQALMKAVEHARRHVKPVADGQGGSAATDTHRKDAQRIVSWIEAKVGDWSAADVSPSAAKAAELEPNHIRHAEVLERYGETWKSKAFKKLMDPLIKGTSTRAGVHRESPVAFDYVHGFLDGTEGRPLDKRQIGGNDGAIEPYLQAYYAAHFNEPGIDIRGRDRDRRVNEIENGREGPAPTNGGSAQGGAIPERLSRKGGEPFKDDAAAWRAVKSRGGDMSEWQVRKVEGGYIAEPRAQDLPKEQTWVPVAPALTYVTDVYGDRYRVDQAALDGDRPMLRTFNAKGDPIDGRMLARDNIDADGSGARDTYATEQVFTKKDGTPFGDEAAARKAVAGRYKQDPDAFDYVPEKGGVVAVRNPEPKPPRADADPSGPRIFINRVGKDGLTDAERAAKAKVDAAAAEAETNPTDAQKEAGNYRMGHVAWQGLDVTIENAKGSERSGKAPDGKEWSVTMPAHYGYLKRTQGADGDHVDVYMGEVDRSDYVLIVNQIDPDTGKFDEHKVVLGTTARAAALDLYRGGFSDGRADERIGSFSEVTVETFKRWLEGDTSKPTAPITRPFAKTAEMNTQGVDEVAEMAQSPASEPAQTAQTEDGEGENAPLPNSKPAGSKPDQEPAKPAKPAYGASNKLVSADRAAELRARLKDKLKNQINAGIDPEIMALGAELAVFHIEAGARRFIDVTRALAADLGATPASLKPYLRSWYNGARDMMEDHDISIDGMDDARTVGTLIKSGVLENIEAGNSTDRPPSDTDAEPTPSEAPDDKRTDDGDGGPRAQEGRGDPTAGAGEAGGVRAEDRGRGGSRDREPERTGERSEPRTDGARDGISERTRRSNERPGNHVIPHGGLQLARGEKTRARESIQAIRTLRALQAESRPATVEERAALAKYGGAGTLAGALPRSDGSIKHADLAAELDELLSADEKATLSRTSQYAFYTAESALRGMWTLAERLGFRGGRVYEPGMGVGGFAGTAPVGTSYTGVELDHVTAQIAAALYPSHSIKQADFIREKLPQGFYDMAIGNPPFSGTQIQADPDYPQRFMIHDYFFAKTLDAVRPGGLLMFITSAGTMNKIDSKARDYLADRADLVGAIRLPNTAFKENGTEVTTDIIVLRKRLEGEAEADPAWRKTASVELPDGDGAIHSLSVNQYFVDHPEMILGEQGAFDTLTGAPRIGVRPRPGADLRADLAEAIEHFPTAIMSAAQASVSLDALDVEHAQKKSGSYYMNDGDLYQFDGNVGRKVERRSRENSKGMPKGDMDAIQRLIPIKDALRDVYAADLDGTDASEARGRLNRAYDAFVKAHGPIGKQIRQERAPSRVQIEGARQQAEIDARARGEAFDVGSFDSGPLIEGGMKMHEIARARDEARQVPGYREGDFDPEDVPKTIIVKRPNIDAFMDDPESYRLLAVEQYDEKTDTAKKTRVFSESAVTRSVEPVINSPEDALLFLLAQTGRVEPVRIAELAKSDAETVTSELEGKIFRDPETGKWETRSKYLSGNIYEKLAAAEAAMGRDPAMERNVRDLRQIMPDPISSDEIRVPLGAHWFDHDIYSRFAASLDLMLEAKFRGALGSWTVEGTERGAAATSQWGTEDKPFAKLMHLLMNNKKIEVVRRPKDKPSYVDETATQAAIDKAKELQEKFSEWIFSDSDRAASLVDLYNRKFNAEVAPAFDGGYLTTPGINSSWSWRPHQTAVVARILQTGNTYMAHTVGAGKTSAMIGAGMEARRLGIAKKPMYVVPNHMLVQFTTEFYQQYPLAKILVADEKRFHTSRRKQFVADAALGDYDAIIITHSGFEKVPASEASKKAAVTVMLRDIKDAFDNLGSDEKGADRAILGALGSIGSTLGVDVKAISEEKGVSTRKKIERLIEAAEQRMSREMSDTGKDQVFDFDEIGVDMLFVDEAHEFRKLSFATTNGDVKGIDAKGAEKSMDLYVKTRAIEAKNPGRGLIFASGTPITNTMAELYTISRYLQPDALDARGISAFDAWAATFGVTEEAMEQNPDGSYKMVARFSKFVNAPELSLMVRQIMDIVSSKDLENLVTRPKLEGGERNLVVVEPSREVKAYQQELGVRMKAIEGRKGPPEPGQDIMLTVIGDGRSSAIDMRLVDPTATGEGSKLERMIQNVYRVWKEGKETPLHGVKPEGGYTDKPVEVGPSTQIVFATMGISGTKKNPDFGVHRFIRAELVKRGVPADDIVMAEDIKANHARKQRAFSDMNDGKKRILIGSKSIFTGVNAQRRLRAIHNLDPLWYPADDEQRNGRGIRQGNMNPVIGIYDYSTKGTYDATMWQMMARKAGFIEGFFRGDPNVREIEDLGEASTYEQAKAMSTADPRVLKLTEMRGERDMMDRRRRAASRQRDRLRSSIRYNEQFINGRQRELAGYKAAAAKVQDLSGDKFVATIANEDVVTRKEAGNSLLDEAEAMLGTGKSQLDRTVGQISGFDIMLETSLADRAANFYLRDGPNDLMNVGFSDDPVGLMRRFETALDKVRALPVSVERGITEKQKELEADREALDKLPPFKDQAKLEELEEAIGDLEGEMIRETKAAQEDAEMRAPEGWDAVEPDAPLTRAELRHITQALREEMERHGLDGKVGLEVVRKITDTASGDAAGAYGRGRIRVKADAVSGPVGVLRHEIVHALRDKSLWGRDYGLFTAAEWRGLVREAKRDAAGMDDLRKRYPDLPVGALHEEAVAEMYRRFRDDGGTDRTGALSKARDFFRALANALIGRGFQNAGRTMRLIAEGEVGGRLPPRDQNGRFTAGRGLGPTGEDPQSASFPRARRSGKVKIATRADVLKSIGKGDAEMRDDAPDPREDDRAPPTPDPTKAGGVTAAERGRIGRLLTQAMGGKVGLLGLVPGRALYSELGAALPSATKYLHLKEGMDAMRDEWHHKTDTVAQDWRKLLANDGASNVAMMNLMHDTTRAGVDPSQPFAPKARPEDAEIIRDAAIGSYARDAADRRAAEDVVRMGDYRTFKRRFDKLPPEFQAMFRRVRDQYAGLADAFDAAVLSNVDKALDTAVKRAERRHDADMARIRDDGLTGPERDEAVALADQRLKDAKTRSRWRKGARLTSLRAQFETNRLDGPYFPLMRFGTFYVTVRDKKTGKVLSFSRFEKVKDQQAFAGEQRGIDGQEVQVGVVDEDFDAKGQVDPNFVADIEDLIGSEVGDENVMDMIWQRWLETLPDRSIRTNRIHRKGTEGFNSDAFRSFGRQMFHGSHQLAKLHFSMDMQGALEEARLEAERADDPNRAGLIVQEMQRRHDFTMNPTGGAVAQIATSAAFVYYLGATPAAALVNITQTSVVGIPIMAAAFPKANVAQAAKQILRAGQDFLVGKGHTENSSRLTTDEKSALAEAYRRGTIDKTQSHDLAGVGETGVEYSDLRAKWMARISWFFHHAERLNREVTFLASYRLAKAHGLGHGAAIDKAADLTWKSHFDYQNTSRPRLMQNDFAKVALVFRNFQLNMLWRLFRDAHQALNGASAAERAEARGQLAGITMSMMLHAGITGTWGYGLTVALLGLFADDGEDDIEEGLKRSLVDLFGKDVAGMMLKGVPGHLAGVDLTSRLGMPDLWFRTSDRTLEGDDVYNYWLQQMLGAVPGMAENMFRGVQKATDGHIWRGVETAAPKFVRDLMQAGRYASEGVETYNGDPLLDEVTIYQVLVEALGFTPAEVSERYSTNSKLKNAEKRITNERRGLLRQATDDIRDGGGVTESTIRRIEAFNSNTPEWPIGMDNIRQSLKSRMAASGRNEGGVGLNPRLNARLRSEAAPGIY